MRISVAGCAILRPSTGITLLEVFRSRLVALGAGNVIVRVSQREARHCVNARSDLDAFVSEVLVRDVVTRLAAPVFRQGDEASDPANEGTLVR